MLVLDTSIQGYSHNWRIFALDPRIKSEGDDLGIRHTRQRNRCAQAAARAVAQRNLAAVAMHNRLRDAEAQAKSPVSLLRDASSRTKG